MKRILGRHIRNLFCTANIKPESIKSQVQADPQISSNYKKAIEFRNKRNFKESNQCLDNILEIVKKQQLQSISMTIELMRKQVANYNQLYDYSKSEKLLEDIVKIFLQKQTSPLMLYGAYDHLVNHCLRTNLTRGVKLAKALISGRHKVELPINYRKTFTMYLGTGYLLLENYRDAKIKLEQCLNDDPSEIIKGCALNNLGVACWWHKHPKFQETQKSESKDSQEQRSKSSELQQIDRDFSNTLNYFKQSIQNFEQVSNMVPGDNKNNIEKLLAEDMSGFIKENFRSDKLFITKNKLSGVPMLNITEFLMTNHLSKIEPMFWLKQSVKFYEEVDPDNNQRALIIMSILQSAQDHLKQAKNILHQVIESLEQSDSYLLVIAIELYAKVLASSDKSKQGEALELLKQAKQVAANLATWSNKIPYLALPKLTV